MEHWIPYSQFVYIFLLKKQKIGQDEQRTEGEELTSC